MLIPCACITCGFPIGQFAAAFVAIRRARVDAALAARGTLPAMAAVDPGVDVELGDVLDALGLELDCCRSAIATKMIFTDYY